MRCAPARLRLLRAPTEGCKYPAAISTADAQFVPADALALVGSQARMHQTHNWCMAGLGSMCSAYATCRSCSKCCRAFAARQLQVCLPLAVCTAPQPHAGAARALVTQISAVGAGFAPRAAPAPPALARFVDCSTYAEHCLLLQVVTAP